MHSSFKPSPSKSNSPNWTPSQTKALKRDPQRRPLQGIEKPLQKKLTKGNLWRTFQPQPHTLKKLKPADEINNPAEKQKRVLKPHNLLQALSDDLFD